MRLAARTGASRNIARYRFHPSANSANALSETAATFSEQFNFDGRFFSAEKDSASAVLARELPFSARSEDYPHEN